MQCAAWVARSAVLVAQAEGQSLRAEQEVHRSMPGERVGACRQQVAVGQAAGSMQQVLQRVAPVSLKGPQVVEVAPTSLWSCSSHRLLVSPLPPHPWLPHPWPYLSLRQRSQRLTQLSSWHERHLSRSPTGEPSMASPRLVRASLAEGVGRFQTPCVPRLGQRRRNAIGPASQWNANRRA